MDLRSCDTKHHIQTIRRGLVTRVCNTDSRGRPSIVHKNLMDVYESENVIRLQKSGIELAFDSVQAKLKILSFPVVDRTLKNIKSEPEEFVCDAGDAGSNDLDDDTTLEQLRNLKRKRKRNQTVGNIHLDNVSQDLTDGDLYEPLRNLKLKCSKTSKAKRNKSSIPSYPDVDFTVEAEKSFLTKDSSVQCCGEFDQVINVKIEVQDPEHLECINKTFSADNSPMGHNEGLVAGGLVSNDNQMDQNEYKDQQPEFPNCVINKISYNHLEDAEPMSMLVPSGGMNDKLETVESGCKDLLYVPPPVIENGNEIEEAHICRSSMSQDITSDTCSNSGCSSNASEISEQSTSFGIQVSSMTTEADYPCKQDSFVTVPDAECGSCPDSIILLQNSENIISTGGATTNELQPSRHASDHSMKDDLKCDVHIEIELCKDDQKQTSSSPISDAENPFCLLNQTYECSETHSSPEHVSPERLPSRRKAMSPSSQERLCMVIGAIELGSDAGLHTVPDCKGKSFGKQTVKDASIVKSDYDKSTDGHTGPDQTILQKATISPRITKRRSKIAKGNLEGPQLLRTLPNFTTGCASIQGCSESAIAFSQRQMHDMEALAEKLMNELKSMKDIVEQKLLFEAYRNMSLKNDADVVKSAINNATKVEDTARKWLSMMSRDCNRFCKIMKMTPNNTTTKGSISREGRRIKFADEAGGKLCHIKFFGDTDFPNADDVKQGDP